MPKILCSVETLSIYCTGIEYCRVASQPAAVTDACSQVTFCSSQRWAFKNQLLKMRTRCVSYVTKCLIYSQGETQIEKKPSPPALGMRLKQCSVTRAFQLNCIPFAELLLNYYYFCLRFPCQHHLFHLNIWCGHQC